MFKHNMKAYHFRNQSGFKNGRFFSYVVHVDPSDPKSLSDLQIAQGNQMEEKQRPQIEVEVKQARNWFSRCFGQ